MAAAKKPAKGSAGANEVDELMRKLKHPLKAEIEAVCSTILGVNPEISEGIKWNSPSFRINEYFATINTRKDVVLVILKCLRDNLAINQKGETSSCSKKFSLPSR